MDSTRALLLAKELQLLNSTESRTLYFHGQSMFPFLREGDELIVQRADWNEIRVGDVVTYRLADKFPTRRVVRRLDDSLLLWCENWPARRFRAARDDVLGVVVARAREGVWLTHRDPTWRRAARRALLKFYAAALFKKTARLLTGAGRKPHGPRKNSQKLPSSSSSTFSS